MKKKILLSLVIFVSVFFSFGIKGKADLTCTYTIDGDDNIFSADNPYIKYRQYIYASDDVDYSSPNSNYNKILSWNSYKDHKKEYGEDPWGNLLRFSEKKYKKDIAGIKFTFELNDESSLKIEYYQVNKEKKFKELKTIKKINVRNISNNKCPDAMAILYVNNKSANTFYGVYSDSTINLEKLFIQAEKSFRNLLPDDYGDGKESAKGMKLIILNDDLGYSDYFAEESCLLSGYYNFDNIDNLKITKSKAGDIVHNYLENVPELRQILDEFIESPEYDIANYFTGKKNGLNDFWRAMYNAHSGNISDHVIILKEATANISSCEQKYVGGGDNVSNRYDWLQKYGNISFGEEKYIPYLLPILEQFENIYTDNPEFFKFATKMDKIGEVCNSASDDFDPKSCAAGASEQNALYICSSDIMTEYSDTTNVDYAVVFKYFDKIDCSALSQTLFKGKLTEEVISSLSCKDILDQYDKSDVYSEANNNGTINWFEQEECMKDVTAYYSKINANKTTEELNKQMNEIQGYVDSTMEKIYKEYSVVSQGGVDIDISDMDSCDFFSSELMNYIKLALNWIRIIGPILVIFLTGYNAIQSIASFKEDGKNKFWKNLKVRLICVVLLILVPTVINFLIDIFKITTCKIK